MLVILFHVVISDYFDRHGHPKGDVVKSVDFRHAELEKYIFDPFYEQRYVEAASNGFAAGVLFAALRVRFSEDVVERYHKLFFDNFVFLQ